MISNTVNTKGMSPSCMRHVAVLLVFSLKFTYVKMKGPNKSINLTLSKSFILFKTKPLVRTREYTNVTNKLFVFFRCREHLHLHH